MNNTQDHLNIADIKDDLIILKDGGAAVVLQTSAVNFGLLSELEQVAIISGFAQLLNSLSFSIQIVVRSTKLDISSYIEVLTSAQQAQKNPLLSDMMLRYKQFIQATIKDNEVLDKKFYIVVPISSLELGLGFSTAENRLKRMKIILIPRRDQIIRQLNRISLKAIQLDTSQLIKLFFNIYNRPDSDQTPQAISIEPARLSPPQPIIIPLNIPIPQPRPPMTTPSSDQPARPARNHPFVVEELNDTV